MDLRINSDRPWETDEETWRSLVNRVRAGRELAPKTWPGAARCAMALSFDCDHETFELGMGKAAIGRLGWGEFGRRRGVPRILNVLARHDVKASSLSRPFRRYLSPAHSIQLLKRGTKSASMVGSMKTRRN
jgi:hypothetical protein